MTGQVIKKLLYIRAVIKHTIFQYEPANHLICRFFLLNELILLFLQKTKKHKMKEPEQKSTTRIIHCYRYSLSTLNVKKGDYALAKGRCQVTPKALTDVHP